MNDILINIKGWVWDAGTVLGAAVLGFAAYYILFHAVVRIAKRTSPILFDSLIKHIRRPSRVILPLTAVYFSIQIIEFTSKAEKIVDSALAISLITSFAWLLIKLTYVLEDIVLSHYPIKDKDNLQARKVYTQFRIIKRILIVVVAIIALSAILMSFERFRQLGTGILASAGLAGLIIGFAAQKTLSNLLAGVQIAITQPIRLDDVVIVENEWGKIEEITLTYVVVRIWDLRRLVLPISYFIEKPFQNWTRVSADLIGTVYLYVDYTVPVQEIREEFYRILKNLNWDGRAWALQVTDATEHTMQLRALMSAPDSSSAWELRCQVREKLIEFIQKKYPQALPRIRAELGKENEKPASDTFRKENKD